MGVAARTTSEVEISGRRKILSDSFWDRVGLGLTIVAMVSAIVLVLYCTILAIQWYNQPFFGALTSDRLMVNGTRPLGNENWTGLVGGLLPYDKIQKISDKNASVTFTDENGSARQLNEFLSRIDTGTLVTVEVYRPGPFKTFPQGCRNISAQGATCTYQFRVLGKMPIVDFLAQFGIALLVSIALLVMGGAMWVLRRNSIAGRLLIDICAMGAIAVMGRFESVTTFMLIPVWILSICIFGSLFISLGLSFP
jgi:hypothetical protein